MADAEVRCVCGARLLAGLDTSRGQVVLEHGPIYFRRSTDYVTCPGCGRHHQATDLHPGENGPPADPTRDPYEELHHLATDEWLPSRAEREADDRDPAADREGGGEP